MKEARWTAASLVPLLLAWEAAGRLGHFLFLPPLSRVVLAWVRLAQQEQFWRNLLLSIGEVVVGFALAFILGLALGVLMGISRPVEYFFDVYVNVFITAPISALVPVFILLFGLGRESIIATVFFFFFSFFIVVVNTYTGIRSVDPTLLEMARAFQAPPLLVLRRVVIPSALPLVLAGFRLGIGRAVNGFTVGEMLIATVGLGGMIMYYGGAFKAEELYALILTVIAMGLSTLALARWLDRRLTPWLH